MYGTKRIFFVILVALLGVSACGAPTTQAQPTSAPTTIIEPAFTTDPGLPQTEADVPRISLEEARAAFESGAAIIVDVRNSSRFEAGHVPGAISVPLGSIERDLTSVPLNKDQWIITYCT